jgi:hypothetical protein
MASFPLGRLLATPGALREVPEPEIRVALHRHARGDWGEVGEEDRIANDVAVTDGERVLSAYVTDGGVRFWVITEADRSATTVLLPEEY